MKKNYRQLLLFFVVFLFFNNCLAQQLIKGPYVQNVQKDRATICWVTQEAVVNFGTDSSTFGRSVEEFRVHEIVLDKLQPNTSFYYDIGLGETAKGHFKTAPDFGTSFRFVVVGDTRFSAKPRKIQVQLINAIEDQKPSLVINTGDVVTNGLDASHWDMFFQMNHNLLKSVPYYASLGNHEKDSPYFYRYFSFPGNENYTLSTGAIATLWF